jgi:hypothetical protein
MRAGHSDANDGILTSRVTQVQSPQHLGEHNERNHSPKGAPLSQDAMQTFREGETPAMFGHTDQIRCVQVSHMIAKYVKFGKMEGKLGNT